MYRYYDLLFIIPLIVFYRFTISSIATRMLANTQGIDPNQVIRLEHLSQPYINPNKAIFLLIRFRKGKLDSKLNPKNNQY
jgi:hypothetical protein